MKFIKRMHIITAILLATFAMVGVQASVSLSSAEPREWQSAFWLNLSTELIGAFLTFILIEIFIATSQQREHEARRINEKKQDSERTRVILQINSIRQLHLTEDSNQKQVLVNEMKSLGLLRGSDLSGMNLKNIDFSYGDLSGANISNCDLTGAILNRSILRDAILANSDLTSADLAHADLSGANLHRANMKNVMLSMADHPGYMEILAKYDDSATWDFDSFIGYAIFNETTVLPDGQLWKANPPTEMNKYTR